MADHYQPELGQMCFGQPWQSYEASELLDAAVERIAREWERVIWNRLQREVARPFSNSGTRFDTDGLSIHAYSWDDSEEQPWNLKCGDVELSWYKNSWRGLSSNKQMSNDDIADFLDAALAALSACDTGGSWSDRPKWKPFTLDGETYSETSREEQMERLDAERARD